MNGDADLSANDALQEAARCGAVPVEVIPVTPVGRWGGHRTPIEEVGHRAGECRVNHRIDLVPFVKAALGKATDARALAWREAVADRDLSWHRRIVADEERVSWRTRPDSNRRSPA